MIRGFDVYGRKAGIPKADIEAQQIKAIYSEPCKVSQMTPEDIAKHGAPVNEKAKRVRTFDHIRKGKQEAKK